MKFIHSNPHDIHCPRGIACVFSHFLSPSSFPLFSHRENDNEIAGVDGEIQHLILIDRHVDPLTPMPTQLTYEVGFFFFFFFFFKHPTHSFPLLLFFSLGFN